MNEASKAGLPFDSDRDEGSSPSGKTEDELDRTNTMRRWVIIDADIESDEDKDSPAEAE